MSGYSRVGAFEFPQDLSDNRSYMRHYGVSGVNRIRFMLKVALCRRAAERRLQRSIRLGVCYYGPFKGEFGHFTAHTLPFLMYLHKNGVKIRYCGMELHKPFLVDEKGNCIIDRFYPLRDFFAEVTPSTNQTVPPADVQQEIRKFEDEARESGMPFWNIGDNFYYWFVHRHWLGRGYLHLYDLSKVYQTARENAVCIFPRSKGAKSSRNNGGPWDYDQLIDRILPHVDKVYVVGHPSQSLSLRPRANVEMRITADNVKILEACANSRLIITQHSGVNNLGEFVRRQVLIIYNGASRVEDIGSMNNTMLFRQYMKEKYPLRFAFNEQQVADFVKSYLNENTN